MKTYLSNLHHTVTLAVLKAGASNNQTIKSSSILVGLFRDEKSVEKSTIDPTSLLLLT